MRSGPDWVEFKKAFQAATAELRAADTAIDLLTKDALAGEAQRSATAFEIAEAIAAQEELVAFTRKGWGAEVGTFGGVEVHEWWVRFPGGGGPIKGAKVHVSRSGNLTTYNTVDIKVKKKGGLGGAAVGGALLGPAGAVIGFGLRRKTEVKTTNTPHTVDTRQELVQISGKGFSYATEFKGWGTGTELANLIGRLSSSATSPEKELSEREEQLALMKKRQASDATGSRRKSIASQQAISEAWNVRERVYKRTLAAWKNYTKSRPTLLRHLLVVAIPGIEQRAFNVLVPVALVGVVGPTIYSLTHVAPSPNLADVIALASFLIFVLLLLDARGAEPKKREKR